MTEFDPETLTFKGTGPEECEQFVSAIRRRALAEGKHRDNEWIAYLASSCFVGEALYWYEGLDQAVQSNWRHLRHAILERFGQGSQSQGVSLRLQTPLAHTIPTPAAAPPIPFNSSYPFQRCRLKVIDLDGIDHGYIQLTSTPDGRLGQLCKTPSQALHVSAFPSNTDVML
ncbi:hypothetical protein M407DRAFT_19079 [Tulasnella calospora MUT 4182]|uniref:Retrotransposon gag domain-containing protein n=1 Tax=Tulasnella calospora MUT 4182 TaxID=1051891 RepID=A0A0C3QUD8_9AGAM|nr:hypothetical protein M407DRAFT_19079 [Tulasnella calospora MUT 4182]